MILSAPSPPEQRSKKGVKKKLVPELYEALEDWETQGSGRSVSTRSELLTMSGSSLTSEDPLVIDDACRECLRAS